MCSSKVQKGVPKKCNTWLDDHHSELSSLKTINYDFSTLKTTMYFRSREWGGPQLAILGPQHVPCWNFWGLMMAVFVRWPPALLCSCPLLPFGVCFEFSGPAAQSVSLRAGNLF